MKLKRNFNGTESFNCGSIWMHPKEMDAINTVKTGIITYRDGKIEPNTDSTAASIWIVPHRVVSKAT